MVFAYRFASVSSSARASAHEANSAGLMETAACEKSRTLICGRRHIRVSIGSMHKCVLGFASVAWAHLRLDLRLDKRKDRLVQACEHTHKIV